MELEPVTKLDKKNTATSKKFDVEVKSENWDVTVIFPIYGQFGAIRKQDFGLIVCNAYIFINTNSLPNKNPKQN